MALTKIPANLLDKSANVDFADSEKLRLGTSNDLQIYHDGSNNYIDTSTGSLLLRNTSDDSHVIISTDNGGGGLADYFRAKGDTGEAILYHYGNEKLKTTSSGASVTGTLTVTGDLDITGDINSYNVTDLDVTDQTITLGAGQTEANSGGSGIIIDGSSASILWDETNDTFDINKGLNVDSDTFVVDNTNNRVGIGTSSPSVALDISQASARIKIQDGTNQLNMGLWDGTNHRIEGDSNRKLLIASYHTDGIHLGGSGASHLVVKGGKVGIGTTSPQDTLHVITDSSTTNDTVDVARIEATSSGTPAVGFGPTIDFRGERGGASSDSMGRIGYVADVMTASRIDGAFIVETAIDGTYSEHLRVTSAGNVGIGTTSPAQKLHIANNGFAYARMESTAYGGTGMDIGQHSGGSCYWNNRDATSTIFMTNNTERMRIDSSGRVGIGTTSPGVELDIKRHTNAYPLRVSSEGGQGRVIVFADVASSPSKYNWIAGAQYNVDNAYEITPSTAVGGYTFSNPAILVKSDGNVGIGNTSPTSNLTIGSSQADGLEFTYDSSNSYRNRISNYWTSATDTRMDFEVSRVANAAPIAIMSVGYNSNVGIGTTSPSATLDVTSNAQNVFDLETTNSDGPLQTFINNGTVRGYIGNAEGAMGQGTANFAIRAQGELIIGTNGNNERMRIDTSGNVGIGTNSPSNPLHVVGVRPTRFERSGVGAIELSIDNLVTNSAADLVFEGKQASTGFLFRPANSSNSLVNSLAINRDGRVGIGNTSPSHFLDIKNNSSTTNPLARLWNNNGSWGASSGIRFLTDISDSSNYPESEVGNYRGTSSNADAGFYMKTGTSTMNTRYKCFVGGKHTFYGTHQGDSVGHFLFTNNGYDSASTNCSLVVENGYTFLQFMAWTSLGARIGTRTGGWNSTGSQVTYLVSGDTSFAYGNTSGNFFLGSGTAITSDERLKKNIVSTPDGQLAKINALRPVSFDWKDTRKDSGEGFIAQEVEAIIPEAVAESEYAPDPDDDTRDFDGDVKSIRDGVLLSRLVKAVQELSAELDAAKARITELEG